jgi:hypothetical protein
MLTPLQVWIEYAAERQLLSVFYAEHSVNGCLPLLNHCPAKPAVSAHLNLFSYVGERARIGFLCYPVGEGGGGAAQLLLQQRAAATPATAGAGESAAAATRGSAARVAGDLAPSGDVAALDPFPGAAREIRGHADSRAYVIALWSFEVFLRRSASAGQTLTDAARTREAASTELTAILSALQEIGEAPLVRRELH